MQDVRKSLQGKDKNRKERERLENGKKDINLTKQKQIRESMKLDNNKNTKKTKDVGIKENCQRHQ